MAHEVVATEKAPAAIGPYSQGMRLGGLVFTAGQIPLDPSSGKLVEGDVTVQAEQVMKNLAAVLEAGGSSLSRVVKTTCFLVDLDDFAAFNEVYGRHMGDSRPARSTIQVAKLPAGARVEVEAIADCS
ncbi:MAG TPA: RidA family protein [Thermomicrobiales bacterium]|nr:RidA family protein [Thermomicrobiales bacterium]